MHKRSHNTQPQSPYGTRLLPQRLDVPTLIHPHSVRSVSSPLQAFDRLLAAGQLTPETARAILAECERVIVQQQEDLRRLNNVGLAAWRVAHEGYPMVTLAVALGRCYVAHIQGVEE